MAARSEAVDSEQKSLPEETLDADLAAVAAEIEALEPGKPSTKRQQPKRQPLPPQLPRREVRHEPKDTSRASRVRRCWPERSAATLAIGGALPPLYVNFAPIKSVPEGRAANRSVTFDKLSHGRLASPVSSCGFGSTMFRTSFTLAALTGAFFIHGAAAADADLTKPVPRVAARVPSRIADSAVDRTVDFAMWKSDVAFGEVIGELANGLFCSGRPLKYSKQNEQWLVGAIHRSFKERATDLGFVSADATKSVFEEKSGNSADFRFGATLLALDFRSCGGDEVKGEAYAKLKWEVFSARRQRVVYTATLESSFASDRAINEKEFDRSFAKAIVDNLFGDPHFVEMIRSGGVGEDKAAVAFTPIQLEPGTSVPGGVVKVANELRAAVVTIESGVGSGTGFYVSPEGYLLTNSHVVADAKFVRIKYSDGRTAVGEVIRTDKPRDVALLRTDPVPSLRSLGIRRGEPMTGEEVYAIGSPFGDTLSGTLTRGVMSSRRIVEGVAFLQSDVSINPGNSGGPLVDASGMVIGIAQIKGPTGINLFIPIDEALDKLALTLKAR